MSMGPITQFSKSDNHSTFVFLKTAGNFSNFTFANGGYIINIKPIARGILVVPVEKELMNVPDDGNI